MDKRTSDILETITALIELLNDHLPKEGFDNFKDKIINELESYE